MELQIFLVLLLFGPVALSMKIVLLPGQIGENIYTMHSIAEDLMGRGHSVHSILPSTFSVEGLYIPKDLQLLRYSVPQDMNLATSKSWQEQNVQPLLKKRKE